MTDIVQRLRAYSNLTMDGIPLYDEAANEIEKLRALKTPASRHLLNITKACLDDAEAEVTRLQSSLDAATKYWPKDANEIKQLRGLLKGCADGLADQIEGHYAQTKDHPAMKRRYDRDMQPVLAAREALAGRKGDTDELP